MRHQPPSSNLTVPKPLATSPRAGAVRHADLAGGAIVDRVRRADPVAEPVVEQVAFCRAAIRRGGHSEPPSAVSGRRPVWNARGVWCTHVDRTGCRRLLAVAVVERLEQDREVVGGRYAFTKPLSAQAGAAAVGDTGLA